MTKGERERAMSELHAARKVVIDSVAGLSKAQLNWAPAPGRWSVADVVEHLALTEDLLMGVYKKTVAGPLAANLDKKPKDEEVLAQFRNRDNKVQAPEPVVPKRTFPSTEAALAAFKQKRDATILFVETNQDMDVRKKLVENFGIDAYQLILGIAGHSQRHVEQIKEIKATTGFPKK